MGGGGGLTTEGVGVVVVRVVVRRPLRVRRSPRRCPSLSASSPARPSSSASLSASSPRHHVVHVPSSSSSWLSTGPPRRRGRVVLILVVIYVRPRPCRACRVAWIHASIGAPKISNKSQHIFTHTWLFSWLFGCISFVSVARSQ